jgi:hypothetical protein
MQCQKKKRDGNQCRARARSGQNCCALHAEPGKAAELGSKGGRRRAVYSPEGLQEFPAPRTAADLRDLLRGSPQLTTVMGPTRPLSGGGPQK